jgi:hypothetical protein
MTLEISFNPTQAPAGKKKKKKQKNHREEADEEKHCKIIQV